MSFSDIPLPNDGAILQDVTLSELFQESKSLFHNTSELERTLFQHEMLPNHELSVQHVKQELGVLATPKEYLAAPEPVSTDDYTGPYDFDVFFDPNHGCKNPWVYSSALKKIFILINKNFPVEFKCAAPKELQLFIRATPVFSASQFSQEIVSRCISHQVPADPSNKGLPFHIWDHIMRSNDSNARYDGEKQYNQRLSIVVPLEKPQPGTDTVRKMFQFVCQNSCPSGMNRRQIEIVYTLEDSEQNIFGRKVVNVRICSCPKRDKLKEEMEYYKSGRGALPPPSKKRKIGDKSMSDSDSEDVKEYNLNIPGKKNFRLLLNMAHGIVSSCIMNKSGNEQVYKKYLTELNQKLNDLSES